MWNGDESCTYLQQGDYFKTMKTLLTGFVSVIQNRLLLHIIESVWFHVKIASLSKYFRTM